MRKAAGTILAVLFLFGDGRVGIASPVFLTDNPTRPSDSRLLLATTGVFLQYQLIATDALLSARITILDEITSARRTFTLSFNTTINGSPLRCDNDAVARRDSFAADGIQQYHLCASLPSSFQAGKTRIAILYWPHVDAVPPNALHDYDTEPASDALWAIRDK